jgi:hypothetical protein
MGVMPIEVMRFPLEATRINIKIDEQRNESERQDKLLAYISTNG